MKTTVDSLGIGIATSLLFGIAFAIPVYEATTWIWQPLELALAIGIGGYVAKALFVRGYQLISIPVNYVGVAVRFGDKPTGALYEAGDHWGFPGISGAIPVDIRHQRIDLSEKFNASAADATDVGVDGFAFVRVKKENAGKTLNVSDIVMSVRELLESRIRLFTVMVSKAENAVQFRDLLADYLELEPWQDGPRPLKHASIQRRLIELEQKKFAVEGAAKALMDKKTAGEFKRLLGVWGIDVEEVEIEQFDIPTVVKDANLKKATQTALMDAQKIRNTARKAMVDELVASGVNANNAINSVDLLLELAVKKDVREITITDLDKVAHTLGEQIAGVIRQLVSNRQTS